VDPRCRPRPYAGQNEMPRNRWGRVTFISTAVTRGGTMSTKTILIVVVLLLLLGALPTWPYSSAWG
jgi:hypothetical protein